MYSLPQLVVGALLVLVAKLALDKVTTVIKILRRIGDCPGETFALLHPFRTASIVCATWFPPKGFVGHYYAGFSQYVRHGSTCVRAITLWGNIPAFWIADAEAIKAVTHDRALFPKDVEAYQTLCVYGDNLVGSEGAVWKRHRAIAKPAFNEANNALVWLESRRVVGEWFAELDGTNSEEKGDIKVIDTVADLTKATLLVISAAAFGRRVSWETDSAEPPPGHPLAFQPALTLSIHGLLPLSLTPGWLQRWSKAVYLPIVTPAVAHAEFALDALRGHMMEVVSTARSWMGAGSDAKGDAATSGGEMGAALLRNLVEANMGVDIEHEAKGKVLTDDELLSDTFVFLLAGHETTAHSLSFTFALLALHPDIQTKVLEEVERVWGGETPSASEFSYKESMPKFEYILAVFHETLRLFSPVVRLVKTVEADTTIKGRRFTSSTTMSSDQKEVLRTENVQEFMVDVPKDSIVVIDIFALHRNPIHWGEDANEFKPERFIDTETHRWPRDAFHAFTAGPRSCIGQRFALAEAVCIIAQIVRRYEILLPEELLRPGVTREAQETNMLSWLPGVTIVPKSGKVRLRRRKAT